MTQAEPSRLVHIMSLAEGAHQGSGRTGDPASVLGTRSAGEQAAGLSGRGSKTALGAARVPATRAAVQRRRAPRRAIAHFQQLSERACA